MVTTVHLSSESPTSKISVVYAAFAGHDLGGWIQVPQATPQAQIEEVVLQLKLRRNFGMQTSNRQGEMKISKSPDTEPEFKTGKHQSSHGSKSSRDTVDKAEEKPKLKGLQPVNNEYRAVMDYQRSRLKDKLQKNDEHVAKKVPNWNKLFTIQKNSQIFNGSKPMTRLRSTSSLSWHATQTECTSALPYGSSTYSWRSWWALY